MDRIVDWVVGLMTAIGAPGVGIAIALETVFPPIPSELVLPLAGFTAGQGRYPVWAAIVWATAGSVTGALVMYYLGAAWGQKRLAALADRIPLTSHEDVDRAVDWFRRHGRSAVFLGRLVPGVRSLISIPAGIDRMPMAEFLLFTTLGSGLWNTALILAGYALGARYAVVERYVNEFSGVIAIIVGGLVLWFVGKRMLGRFRELRRHRSEHRSRRPRP